jgi:hypothetical protein
MKTLLWAIAAFALLASFGFADAAQAQAQGYAVGQSTQCDATGLHKYYQSGTVIAAHPGETFNGYAVGSGYFYRVRIDGGDPEGTLCKAEDMKAAQAEAPAAAAAQRPADAPVAPTRAMQAAPGAAGNRFGAREPRVSCAPVKSMPNTDQIKALVQCDDEYHSNNNLIYLDENLSVQAGGTRSYSQFSDGYATGIDTDAPVLPIRGSLDSYQCAPLSKFTNTGTVYDTDNTDKNCVITPIRQAQGTCYRTTFGDWLCHLNKGGVSSTDRRDQPPPR